MLSHCKKASKFDLKCFSQIAMISLQKIFVENNFAAAFLVVVQLKNICATVTARKLAICLMKNKGLSSQHYLSISFFGGKNILRPKINKANTLVLPFSYLQNSVLKK